MPDDWELEPNTSADDNPPADPDDAQWAALKAAKQRRAARPAGNKPPGPNDLVLLPKQADGWWLDASRITPDCPQWGPWPTKQEAEEARSSYLRNNIDRLLADGYPITTDADGI